MNETTTAATRCKPSRGPTARPWCDQVVLTTTTTRPAQHVEALPWDGRGDEPGSGFDLPSGLGNATNETPLSPLCTSLPAPAGFTSG